MSKTHHRGISKEWDARNEQRGACGRDQERSTTVQRRRRHNPQVFRGGQGGDGEPRTATSEDISRRRGGACVRDQRSSVPARHRRRQVDNAAGQHREGERVNAHRRRRRRRNLQVQAFRVDHSRDEEAGPSVRSPRDKVGEDGHLATVIGLLVDLERPLRTIQHGEGSAGQAMGGALTADVVGVARKISLRGQSEKFSIGLHNAGHKSAVGLRALLLAPPHCRRAATLLV